MYRGKCHQCRPSTRTKLNAPVVMLLTPGNQIIRLLNQAIKLFTPNIGRMQRFIEWTFS